MKKINLYPTATGGLCLGIASIFAFWSTLFLSKELAQILLIIGGVITSSLLIPLLIKFMGYPSLLIQDIKHPTVGSIVPATMMTLMLLSRTLGLFNTTIAVTVWSLAVVGHVMFLTSFVYYRITDFDLNHIVPTWFVPPIGIVVACLSMPTPFFLPLAHVFLFFGMVVYFALLPIMLYRLIIGDRVEDVRKPTLAVLAAPPSLILAGYLAVVDTLNPVIVIFLFSIAIVMTLSVYLMLLHLLRLSYTPACTAFTFPLAISAVAMNKVSHWMDKQPLFHDYSLYFYHFSIVEGVIATFIIFYILYLFVFKLLQTHF